ncbi:mechanosensitive ion channel family protein [Pseudoflavonifractor phocaeensis]|uniref:mechanosensitive ion channel family protein n=1 Tax=Pseudoflavonifractor phocaeensis TaxID=1870988 RepID=UPI00210C7B07|nr:mechanosensitive ion channel family protein [Pseudoflavonifractor phocaeensis]MCQ4865728.1 mechanosensitive ion channel family protein [Pseudoflavonifractor phocaeensis]
MTDVISTAAPEFIDSLASAAKVPITWRKLLYTILIIIACAVVIKIIMSLVERAIKRIGVERSLHTFIKSVARILLWFIAIATVLGFLGVNVTSLIAIFSVAGLAISLAIQGTLSNLAGGIMILVSKPFKVGDYIEAGGMGGTVADIGLVYTRMKTFDNKLTFVPNGEIAKEKITNYTSQETRRVDLKFNTSYDAPVELVKGSIQGVVGAHPKALFTPEPFVRVSAYKDSSIEYTVRVWCATEDYWDLYSDLLEQVKEAFDRSGIEMTYNHLNVHMMDK